MEVLSRDWLEELVGVAMQPGVGAVAPLLRYRRGMVQHAGIVVGLAGAAGHPWRWRDRKAFTFFGSAEWPRDFLAVTDACLCIRADRFDEVGGLAGRGAPSGVAFCIALHERGYRNVYWPYVSLRHPEAAVGESVGSLGIARDVAAQGPLGPYLAAGDPFFNPNLDPALERIALRPAD